MDQGQAGSPLLVSPDGTRIVINRSVNDGHWIWYHEGHGGGGSIVDAVQQLLGEQSWARLLVLLRRTLASPPDPLPPPNDSEGFGTMEQEGADSERLQEIYSLGERGWKYLVEKQHIPPQTVDAFTHALREDEVGGVIATHEQTDEGWGSEISSIMQSRTTDWLGQQPSLWLALPADGSTPTHLIVAESFLAALQAHAQAPEHLRPWIGLASTGGTNITIHGLERVKALLTEMRCEHPNYADLTLVDLQSGLHDEASSLRTEILRSLAQDAEISFFPVDAEVHDRLGPKTRGTRPSR